MASSAADALTRTSSDGPDDANGHGGSRTYELRTFERYDLAIDSCPRIAQGTTPSGPPLLLVP